MTPDEVMTRLGSHVSKLKGIPLWMLNMTPTETWPQPPANGEMPDVETLQHFVEHIDWLEAQEKANVLVLSGTVDEEYGLGPGMAIIRAGSRAEAEAIAVTEPFHQLGWRHNTIRSWKVNEGSLTVSVKLFSNEVTFG